MHKKIKNSIKKMPLVKPYLSYRNLKTKTKIQDEEIIGLQEAVKRLEDRNEEWAQEVRQLRGDGKPLPIVWPVKTEDIVNAQWYHPQKNQKKVKSKLPLRVSWVVPPMGQGSGGHADIFRTIHYLEEKGYICKVYFYDAQNNSSMDEVKQNLQHYSPIRAKIYYNAAQIEECDALFATNWYTAYPVYNFKGAAKKYYYVQDFEPYFEPVGTYSTLAENTYKFGFRGITLGSWLTKKLSSEYNMKCDYFELGSDPKEYYIKNHSHERKKIFFYARPVTPRRGFELGILALEQFHHLHPEYEIHFLGWDITPYEIPFPYINHGIMKTEELNDLYNECVAGLVLSFTNMSLLPLEMLASGCIPVINDAEHTRMVSYSKHLKYAEPSPEALASVLSQVVSRNKAEKSKGAQEAAQYAKKFKWDDSNSKIDTILKKELL